MSEYRAVLIRPFGLNYDSDFDSDFDSDSNSFEFVNKIKVNLPTACVYRADPYINEIFDSESNLWFVCYYDSGHVDIELELSNTGCELFLDIHNIKTDVSGVDTNIGIDKPIGLVPYCNMKINKENTKKLYLDLNPELFEYLASNDIMFDPILFEIENNCDYLASYIVTTYKATGYLDEEIVMSVDRNIRKNDICLISFLGIISGICESYEICPGTLIDLLTK